MLTKILFTLAVIIAVAIIFRVKTTKGQPVTEAVIARSGVSAAVVAYTLLGLVLAISALVFVLHWQDQREIISIQVTGGQGETTRYQAYKKDIDGRRFTTLEGRAVDLAASDRIEILGSQD